MCFVFFQNSLVSGARARVSRTSRTPLPGLEPSSRAAALTLYAELRRAERRERLETGGGFAVPAPRADRADSPAWEALVSVQPGVCENG